MFSGTVTRTVVRTDQRVNAPAMRTMHVTNASHPPAAGLIVMTAQMRKYWSVFRTLANRAATQAPTTFTTRPEEPTMSPMRLIRRKRTMARDDCARRHAQLRDGEPLPTVHIEEGVREAVDGAPGEEGRDAQGR